jgi:hypothetical protein
VFEQCEGMGQCVETAGGMMPTADAIDLSSGVSTNSMKE